MQEIRAFDIPSFGRAYNISRAQIYKEIKAGRLRITKVGRRTLISREAGDDWLGTLERSSLQGHFK